MDYDANQITFTSYNVYAQYALFGSEFLNRPPMWEDVPDQASGREGEEIEFDHIGVDPDEDDELFIEMLRGDLPLEARLIDYDDGTGSLNWTPSEGDEGEYLARFTLSDEDDEVVVESSNHCSALAQCVRQRI